jgi:hypothetical protein
MAAVALAKPAINSIYKVTEAMRIAPGHPDDPARASLVASLAIGLRTAKRTLQMGSVTSASKHKPLGKEKA